MPLPLIVKKHGGGLLLGDVLPHLRWGTIEPGGVSFAAPIRSVQRSGRRGVSPSSPIRPSVLRFSQSKRLIDNGSRGPERGKSAVVPTKSILTVANVSIIGGHHVLALQS